MAPTEAMNLASGLLVLGTAVPGQRRHGAGYALFIVINLLPPLVSGGSISLGRMTATLFPRVHLARAAIPKVPPAPG